MLPTTTWCKITVNSDRWWHNQPEKYISLASQQDWHNPWLVSASYQQWWFCPCQTGCHCHHRGLVLLQQSSHDLDDLLWPLQQQLSYVCKVNSSKLTLKHSKYRVGHKKPSPILFCLKWACQKVIKNNMTESKHPNCIISQWWNTNGNMCLHVGLSKTAKTSYNNKAVKWTTV